MIAIAFLASTIFSRSSQATLFGYLVAILSMVSAEILVTSVYDQNSKAPWWFWTYPYYCFYRGIFLMFMPCLDQKQCIQWFDTDTWYGGELGKSYLCMTLQTVIMLILAWYFNHVIPQEFGIRKHPLFMFAPLKKLFKTKRVDDDTIETSKEKSVLAHEQDVYNGVYINEPLVIKKLHKRYASKVALRSLTLGVRRDECFGLLGPNGAGKTTMLSILFGLFPPSSGSAYVAGYPLDKITSIQRHIGVSMQFDVLWDSLTVTEHLTFYSRLKGVRGIKPHVEMLIANVGLEEKKNTQASALSGGMRRRLSLAIAMIGDPQVVFLDEPTTGLDPQSRRSVWDCIEKFQRGRAMILCTHSMDEASVLCHRLGLLNNGELQFVGTQFELREKLAEYKYRLDISFDEENRDHVIEYVYGLVDQGDISSIQDDKTEKEGRASFGLTENVKLSSVWRKMESDSKQIGKINEWALGQMHLETMFVKLIKEQQMEPNADANV
jgi:ABC-type multidrug transport system ATPase subunit